MSATSPDQALGAYLKGLRIQARLDVSVLARRLSLSPAQLLQLESGQASLFYNHRIRQQAARKVVVHLGGDPARVVDERPPPVDANLPVAPTAPAYPEEAVEAVAVAVAPTQALKSGQRAWGRPMLAVLLLGAAALTAATWGPASKAVIDLAKAPVRELEPVRPAPEPAVPLAEAAPVQVAMADPGPEAVADPVPAREAPAQVMATPTLAATADACPGELEQAPTVRPPEANKAGDMVYVVSMGSVSVCLSDGSGKQQRKRLEAGQSHSFYGPPPWVIRSDQLRQTQLYFQGWKVRLPEQAQDRIKLVELR